jgi:two-component system OmpR family response regulator
MYGTTMGADAPTRASWPVRYRDNITDVTLAASLQFRLRREVRRSGIMRTMRILLVEHGSAASAFLLSSLIHSGHEVIRATNVEEADRKWRTANVDVVVLDQLPTHTTSASDLARELEALRLERGRGSRRPVLVLSARNTTEDRIAGLDAGADDYLGKPFDVREVEARLRALVRCSQGAEDAVEVGQLKLDRRARRFALAGRPLDLPVREFQVLWELIDSPGKAIAKNVLSVALSSSAKALSDNAIEAFLHRLRKRLQGSDVAILTIRRAGYMLLARTASSDDRHR